MSRSIYDCFPYNGEIDVLRIRLQELDDLVDAVVIVEADHTFSGDRRDIYLDINDRRIAKYADRIRHVIVRDMPITTDPWIREAWQRDALLRGIADAADDDLVLISDADEIPRAESVASIAGDLTSPAFGFQQKMFYFYVNFRNVSGAEANWVWSTAAKRSTLRSIAPTTLRNHIRSGRAAGARLVPGGGWHYSYLLLDEEGIRQKIGAFSHQEHNNEAFLSTIDVVETIAKGADLFGRPYLWEIDTSEDVPRSLRESAAERRRLSWPPKS